jgi:RimJ/RimL family protein N-acetyltransferase
VAASLTRVAFEIDGVHRVEIHCDPINYASAAVARKIGYNLEATLGERLQRPDGTWRDTMIWTLFAGYYAQSMCAQAELIAFDAANRQIL